MEPSGVTLAFNNIQTYAPKIISEQIFTTFKKPNPKKIKLTLGYGSSPLPLPRIVNSTEQQGELDNNKEDIIVVDNVKNEMVLVQGLSPST